MKNLLPVATYMLLLASCTKDFTPVNDKNTGVTFSKKESAVFSEIGAIVLGPAGASEISAYDPLTKRLFVVNNGGINKIDVLDLSDPAMPVVISSISMAPFGGLVNSVAVSNGKLAAAIEASNKTDNGKAVVFSTTNFNVLATVSVGALPDMITFSPDGKLILTANEGEPNDAYTVDPPGTVSIIDVEKNYEVNTLGFSGFASQLEVLAAKGFRIFGPNASFGQDVEPEYIAVSANSNTAWVTLQENNGVARIDLRTQIITDIFPLGFKDYSIPENAIDPSDQDGKIEFNTWPVKGIYQPDGIAVNLSNGTPFIYTANEGDVREYSGFTENKRINNAAITLDQGAFPNSLFLKNNTNLGRLNITAILGKTNGTYNELYSFGARSFSIWNGNTGEQVYDSRNELDQLAVASNTYADNRSDDKGAEPENLTIGRVGNRNLLFVGLERANAVVVYDITNPVKPVFLQFLKAGVAPEGVLFVDAENSPSGNSLLIVSNETNGEVKIYSNNN
ncbi:MAG: choice-of-anchor I family protein [Bacteroidota bacterium]